VNGLRCLHITRSVWRYNKGRTNMVRRRTIGSVIRRIGKAPWTSKSRGVRAKNLPVTKA
jgi:hypothetical protein